MWNLSRDSFRGNFIFNIHNMLCNDNFNRKLISFTDNTALPFVTNNWVESILAMEED